MSVNFEWDLDPGSEGDLQSYFHLDQVLNTSNGDTEAEFHSNSGISPTLPNDDIWKKFDKELDDLLDDILKEKKRNIHFIPPCAANDPETPTTPGRSGFYDPDKRLICPPTLSPPSPPFLFQPGFSVTLPNSITLSSPSQPPPQFNLPNTTFSYSSPFTLTMQSLNPPKDNLTQADVAPTLERDDIPENQGIINSKTFSVSNSNFINTENNNNKSTFGSGLNYLESTKFISTETSDFDLNYLNDQNLYSNSLEFILLSNDNLLSSELSSNDNILPFEFGNGDINLKELGLDLETLDTMDFSQSDCKMDANDTEMDSPPASTISTTTTTIIPTNKMDQLIDSNPDLVKAEFMKPMKMDSVAFEDEGGGSLSNTVASFAKSSHSTLHNITSRETQGKGKEPRPKDVLETAAANAEIVNVAVTIPTNAVASYRILQQKANDKNQTLQTLAELCSSVMPPLSSSSSTSSLSSLSSIASSPIPLTPRPAPMSLPAPGKAGKNKKESKKKRQPKTITFKFHEFKCSPSAQKNSRVGVPFTEISNELLLQWQLEWRHKYPQILLPAAQKPTAENVPNLQNTVSILANAANNFLVRQSPRTSTSVVRSGTPPLKPPETPNEVQSSDQTTQNSSKSATRATTLKFLTKLEDMKISDLHLELKKRNLPMSGPKPLLVERLKFSAQSGDSGWQQPITVEKNHSEEQTFIATTKPPPSYEIAIKSLKHYNTLHTWNYITHSFFNDHCCYPSENASVDNLGVQTPSNSEEKIDVETVYDDVKKSSNRSSSSSGGVSPTNPFFFKYELQPTMVSTLSKKDMKGQSVRTSSAFPWSDIDDRTLKQKAIAVGKRKTNVKNELRRTGANNKRSARFGSYNDYETKFIKRKKYQHRRNFKASKSKKLEHGRNYLRCFGGASSESDVNSSERSAVLFLDMERQNIKQKQRQRRNNLKNAFEELRKVLPSTAGKKRADKLVILKDAAEFCKKSIWKEAELKKLEESLQQREMLLAEVLQSRRPSAKRKDSTKT